MRPRLLLLDEPLASLDVARKREILPYLERLRDEVGRAHGLCQPPGRASCAGSPPRWCGSKAGQVEATGGKELLDAADADAVL